MQIEYLVNPTLVFKDEEGGIMPYPADWKKPFELYNPTGTTKPKSDKNLVLVQITGPSKKETNKHAVEIELFHCGADGDVRRFHLSAHIPGSGFEGVHVTCNSCTPKLPLLKMLWRSSPFNLVKCLVKIEEQIVKDGIVHAPVFSEILAPGQESIGFEPNVNWNDFYLKFQFLLKW